MGGVVDHADLPSVAELSLLCRRGLAPFSESVGFELFDPEMGSRKAGPRIWSG